MELKAIRRALAIFRAYMLSDLVRSSGFITGLVVMTLWICLLILPMALFLEGDAYSTASSYAFVALMIYLLYVVATWDWAAELRYMINDGRLEYYIVSGSGFLPHYLGLLPVSLMWVLMALGILYAVLSAMWGPPALAIREPLILAAAFAMLLVVLIAYALVFGGTMLSSGVSGFIVEIVGFVIPIAGGGMVPLSNLPAPLRSAALALPFGYPAELIRYSLIGLEPALPITDMILRGTAYSSIFLAVAALYFRYQLRKMLRNGVRITTFW